MRRSTLAVAALVAGCSPVQPIVGSYFPSWLICGVAGVVATAIIRQLFVVAKLEKHLLAPPLTYLAMAICIASLLWLLLFAV